jgi:hypothetical protein
MPNVAEQTVIDLVQRSRLGDQVATATIATIAAKAKSGDKAAEKVRRNILKYTEKHPQVVCAHLSMFGIDRPLKEDIVGDARILHRNLGTGRFSGAGLAILILGLGEYATGVLFYGPWLFATKEGPNPILDAVREALADDSCRAAFDVGNRATNRPAVLEKLTAKMGAPQKKACHLGILLGRARRLQAVSKPGTPIRVLNVETAWELGE